MRKFWNNKRDKLSAAKFVQPGRCLAEKWKLLTAAVHVSVLISLMMARDLDRALQIIFTVERLSHMNKTRFVDQSFPHTTAAAMMGYSSRKAIDRSPSEIAGSCSGHLEQNWI